MSIAEQHPVQPPALPNLPRRIEVQWSSLVAPQRGCSNGSARNDDFVITLDVVDVHRATVEAWLEGAGRRRAIIERQPVGCRISVDSDMLHVDADLDGRRVIALSIPRQNGRATYASTDYLAEAGLGGGSCDPPTVREVNDWSE